MGVKGQRKGISTGDKSPAPPRAQRDEAAKGVRKKDTVARGGVARRERSVSVPAMARRIAPDGVVVAKEPTEIAAAVEASKNAFEHMLKVITESASQPEGSTVFVGEPVYTGPVTNEALAAFIGAVEEVAGDKEISVAAARRAGLVAAASAAWENALGPQLETAHVRELLGGVSRQRISELLRQHRLIAMQTSNTRWQFPAFQFVDGRLPSAQLAEAFWKLSTRAIDPWSAAAWCVSPNDQLDGHTPAEAVARDGDLVAAVGERDADRLSR